MQLIISLHEDMNACIQFDGNTSESFKARSGVKQGCVLAPTLFAIYFAALLQYAFDAFKMTQKQIRWISFQSEKTEVETTDTWHVD